MLTFPPLNDLGLRRKMKMRTQLKIRRCNVNFVYVFLSFDY